MKAAPIAGIALPAAASAFLLSTSPFGDRYYDQRRNLVHNRKAAAAEHRYLFNTKLNLFGNLFGNDDKTDDQKDLEGNELARFSNLLVGDDYNIDVKFDSLSILISSWAKMFSDHKSMGLTTPVDVVELPKTVSRTGVQLLFKKGVGGRSAYNDKEEDEDDDKRKAEKEKSVKEGGVQVTIEKLASSGDLEVIASRCEVDEGTMIKEMSEEAILDSLRKAVQAWKKEQQQ
jgi:hypothetical protein